MNLFSILEKDGYVLTLSVGVSMRPMLHERREQLLIEKCTQEPQVNDVVLFRRSNDQYVLHRIVKKYKDYYVIRGDNCYDREEVRPNQIIGYLKGFYRGEKYICCASNPRYLCYVAFWRITYPIRLGYFKLRKRASSIKSRFRR